MADKMKPADARAWVESHTSGSRTFGPAFYEPLSANTGRFRSLTITGAP